MRRWRVPPLPIARKVISPRRTCSRKVRSQIRSTAAVSAGVSIALPSKASAIASGTIYASLPHAVSATAPSKITSTRFVTMLNGGMSISTMIVRGTGPAGR